MKISKTLSFNEVNNFKYLFAWMVNVIFFPLFKQLPPKAGYVAGKSA